MKNILLILAFVFATLWVLQQTTFTKEVMEAMLLMTKALVIPSALVFLAIVYTSIKEKK